MSLAATLLTEAAQIVAGPRNTTHGDKERSFAVIAEFWNCYLAGRARGADQRIREVDVAQMMVLMKIARSIQGEPIRDHFVDQAGYSAIAAELWASSEVSSPLPTPTPKPPSAPAPLPRP